MGFLELLGPMVVPFEFVPKVVMCLRIRDLREDKDINPGTGGQNARYAANGVFQIRNGRKRYNTSMDCLLAETDNPQRYEK